MRDRRLRILHVFRAPLGGLFRHVVDVTRAQVARGHEVGIFCDASTGGERANEVLDDLRPLLALGVTRVRMRRDPNWTDLTAMLALRRVCQDMRPDVLHGHGSKGGAYVRLTRSDASRTAIRAYTPHGGSFNYHPGSALHRVYMLAEAILARRTDLFLFESEFIAGRAKPHIGAAARLIRVVHNGIGEAEFAPVVRAPDPYDLLYIGELRPAKGVETLIDALRLIRVERKARLTLLVVGSGPSSGDIRARVEQAGLSEAIAFVPPAPIREVLGRGRVMVIPSYAESLPYVILEAAAAAQPLVSTNVGGIPEIFGPRVGELVPPGDPRALAQAIIAKLGEPASERSAKARALSDFVRCRFSLDQMVLGVLDGYETAFAARDLARPTQLVPAE